jgi:ParB family chromosome partitioning protein
MTDCSGENKPVEITPDKIKSGRIISDELKLAEIDLSDIDLTDERYRISYSDENITRLAQSIRETGLIHPPMVKLMNDKFIIVSGFNRIRALIKNCAEKTLVVQLPALKTDLHCLVAAVSTRAFQRELSHFELIVGCTRLAWFLDKKEIAQKSAAVFNMELNSRFVGELLTIGTLPDPAMEMIRTGKLSLKSAGRISSLDPETIHGFLNLFSKIHASTNKQLEIILYITEISARDGIEPRQIFNDPIIQDILEDDNKDPGSKTKVLRARLFAKRYPTLSDVCQHMDQKIAGLKLDTRIRFSPPENFESQNYTISFAAKNFSEFEASVKSLRSALENNTLKEILAP